MHLIALDETDHDLKDMANLLVDALRDWGNCQDIVSCIAGFKAYFGDPLTVENTAHYSGRDPEDWVWRGEAGMALSKIMQRSIAAYQIADFDTIVDRFLSYYEQKFLLTSKGQPLSHTGFAAFHIYSESLSRADIVHWLGIEPDGHSASDMNYCILKTSLTPNLHNGLLVRQLVSRLIPVKDRLIALKLANPEVDYELQVVFWSTLPHFSLDSDVLLLLGEIGVRLESEIFMI